MARNVLSPRGQQGWPPSLSRKHVFSEHVTHWMGGPVLSINVGLGGSHGDGIWGALHTAGERTSGIAWYPLYQLGGPQLRVFRTNFFIQLVRPGTAQPEDTVQFRIPMEMTRVDLRNYLEQIYNVPVAAVRTRVQHGSNRRRDHKSVRIKKPDYKVAYVQLAHGQTFTFPDLFPEKDPSPADPLEEEPQLQRQSSDPRCPGIPSWFGL
ncbi:39S ribosomal protein L23 [Cricetulus griseus]|uniref:Large ribosomal subunit protein uL23m n=1 Tax=Cricetulus griseus TaxID=10029 RepID=A0A061ID04_CRIGR|nr:39S ribosomal protein L23 [Cricetulus griseus]